MKVNSSRFGTLDIGEKETIDFPQGIIGFADERSFVLLRPRPTSPIGWLQSLKTAPFAVPVISVEALAAPYPQVEAALAKAGDGKADTDHSALMVVLNAPGSGLPATVNLLAPIVVNADTRVGAQVLLDGSDLSTQEPLILKADAVPPAPTEGTTSAVAKPPALAENL